MIMRVARFASLFSIALPILGACAAEEPEPTQASAGSAPQFAVVETTMMPLERRLDGIVEAVNQATVSAQTSGRVAEILYDVNDFVPAGAVIVRLRGPEQRASLTQAEAALREASAREAEAQTHHRRIADMFERRMVARAMLDEATAGRDAAVARLVAARAAVAAAREGVAYTEIRAPYAGVVTRRHVEVGEAVAPGTALMSGLSLQFLRVSVDVPQSIVRQVRLTRRAVVYADGQRIEAAKITVFPTATAPANTFRARVDLPENSADLYPGMFVKVGFVVGQSERLLIPVSAMVERAEVRAVYVLDSRSEASLRQIRTGHRFEDRVEVLAGLEPGERIALDPIEAMRLIARRVHPQHE